MATNTLTDRSAGETIQEGFFNDIHQALEGVVVGRNSSGVPTSGQSLGTPALPWGTIYGNGIVIGGSSVDTSQVAAPPFRVTSGKTRTSSNQPAYLTPAGSGNGASVTVAGATTNLTFDVNGTSYSITSDIVKASLTLAPSSNNTMLVDDTDAAGADNTRVWGEQFSESLNHKLVINTDTVGSEISSRDGEYHAFLKGTEVMYGLLNSSGTELIDVKRGYFYDENLDPLNRTPLSDNNTLTLLSVNYLFADIDGSTIDSTVTKPAVSHTAPASPATGDYWFDLGNTLWKRYDGATFQTVDRTFIGFAVCDDTDCLYARCVDFDARYKIDNTIGLQINSTEIIDSVRIGDRVNVAGNEIVFTYSPATWNITTDLAASEDMYSASEGSSTIYYLYVADDGETIMSDIQPYVRNDLGGGLYHPHNPWRMVGRCYNDGSSDIVSVHHESKVRGRKFQEKINDTVLSADGTASDLTLNNLMPGVFYEVNMQASLSCTGSSGAFIRLDATHNSIVLSRFRYNKTANDLGITQSNTFYFQCDDDTTTLTFEFDITSSGTLAGNSLKTGSYVQIKELDIFEVSDF